MVEFLIERSSDRGSTPLISINGILDLKVEGISLDFQHFKDSPALYTKFCRAVFGSRNIEFIR